jgi:hypothetical protein
MPLSLKESSDMLEEHVTYMFRADEYAEKETRMTAGGKPSNMVL